VLRRLLTPRWLGALVLAVLAAVACYHLGQWQYGRHVYKVERNARLDANYTAAPRPLSEVMTGAPLPVDRQWTRVTATGRYAASTHLYVRNRPNGGVYGFEVVAPFRLDDGSTVLVDRGWVANSGAGADVLPPVPAPPTGEVTLTGWTLPGEQDRGRDLPAGQLASMSVPDASKAVGSPLLGGYVLLESERDESGATPPRPAALERPDRSLGPHQAYAYQWWLTMPLGFVLMWFGIRRELRAEAEARGTAPARPPRPKRVRIWDEEDA
jgi:cytochrome oxidase assembly protein ShyY1